MCETGIAPGTIQDLSLLWRDMQPCLLSYLICTTNLLPLFNGGLTEAKWTAQSHVAPEQPSWVESQALTASPVLSVASLQERPPALPH